MADNPIYDPRERELFEATMRKDRYHDFAFYEPGNIYNNLFTQAAWLAWQRRAALGVKPDRVACPEHRDLGPIPTCKACREQAQPNPACRFNGRSTRTCALGTLGCVIDHGNAAGVPGAGKTVDGGM